MLRLMCPSLHAYDADPSAMDCTAIGLKSKDGVVLAVEKCVTSLLLVILHLHLLIYIVSVNNNYSAVCVITVDDLLWLQEKCILGQNVHILR